MKTKCDHCGEVMEVLDCFEDAKVTHLDCAMEGTKGARDEVLAKGLDKAKAHVNKECPHA